MTTARGRRLAASEEFQRLYKTAGWRKLRAEQLKAHPLCQCPHCQEGKIRITPAAIVDHQKPHRGDRKLFFDRNNLRSLSKLCHDRFKKSQEAGGKGFKSSCGADGLPIDPAHFWNRNS